MDDLGSATDGISIGRTELKRADMIHAEAAQAQAMIRRVSPEGRAEARRLRERRARRVRSLALGWLAIAAVAFAVCWIADRETGPLGTGGFAIATATMLLACALLAWRTRERPAGTAIAPGTPLMLLGERTQAWAGTHRAALPAPAAALVDAIGSRLDSLAPQLARMPAGSGDADSLRRLVAGELPALVDRYRAVPATLRAEPGADGVTPDSRLLHGLATVDRELADLTRRIGAGAVDELSTQDRYLDGKYRADDPLGG